MAKRAAPVTKTNAYYYDHAAYPDQPKTNDDDGPTPDIASEYVQLFSWSVVASILNCYYRIFAKKRNRKDPSKLKIMHQNCEKKFTKILLCLFSS